MMLLVTAVTNLCMFPAIVNLHKQAYVFEVRLWCVIALCASCSAAFCERHGTHCPICSCVYVFVLVQEFIGAFTMVTSFLYHCCDSIDGPLWLTEVRQSPRPITPRQSKASSRVSDSRCDAS